MKNGELLRACAIKLLLVALNSLQSLRHVAALYTLTSLKQIQ